MSSIYRWDLGSGCHSLFALGLIALSMLGCDQKGERWEAPCGSGDLAACASLAQSLDAADSARKASLAERACTGGEASGCRILGEVYERGEGVVANPQRAREFLIKACQGGDLAACEKGCDRHEAVMCLTTAARASRGGMDLHRAATYFEKACQAGHPVGCDELASLLKHNNFSTIKINRDQAIARAYQLRKQACVGEKKPDFCVL